MVVSILKYVIRWYGILILEKYNISFTPQSYRISLFKML